VGVRKFVNDFVKKQLGKTKVKHSWLITLIGVFSWHGSGDGSGCLAVSGPFRPPFGSCAETRQPFFETEKMTVLGTAPEMAADVRLLCGPFRSPFGSCSETRQSFETEKEPLLGTAQEMAADVRLLCGPFRPPLRFLL
jgi:hypothetical protein